MAKAQKVRQRKQNSGTFNGSTPDVGKAAQFNPGVSGNPGGCPKSKCLTDAYRRGDGGKDASRYRNC